MLSFTPTSRGMAVLIDYKTVGYLEREGLCVHSFSSLATVTEHIKISPEDLRKIADKAEELGNCHQPKTQNSICSKCNTPAGFLFKVVEQVCFNCIHAEI